ncbi:MAG: chemotaxis protein CheW, partial [Acidobacteria bacterium]|nr:chemotaxis protein CheW [Acidobacteriota bacterium]
PIAHVVESDKLAEVTPLPRVSEAIRGLIHLRGEILPMVDLRLILGSKSYEVDERMLIVRTKNSSGACGLAVDRVSGLIAIRPHELEQCESKYVSSYCERQGRQIGLLDLDRVFESLSNPLAVRECDV